MPDFFGFLDSNSRNDVFPERFSNQIYFSQGSHIHFAYRSVYSIKYAIKGEELYEVGGRFHRVKANHFLVVNNEQDVLCLPGNCNKGVSIFIDPGLMADVFKNLSATDDELLSSPFYTSGIPLFFEHLFVLENGPLKLVLSEIVSSFEADQSKKFRCTIDLFYRIAGAFILSQRQTFQCFKRMHAAKSSTRDELFRRMLAAREYMNDLWSSPVTIEELARAVFMSPFHFHRTFTTTFAITPAQYLKKIRMQKAKELMRLNCTISEVAVKVGYDDIFSFSKAFKKMFGLPPSHPQALQDS